MNKVYPEHIYDPIRQKVAVSYIKREFRKLFLSAPASYWKELDRDIENWINSPVMGGARDFWNGFHGICMGFKLNIGLTYYLTAENVSWSKEVVPIDELNFGATIPQTKVIKDGKATIIEAREFYDKPENKNLRTKWAESLLKVGGGKSFENGDPIIVVQKLVEGKMVKSIYDGHNRVAKIMFERGKGVHAYIGKYTSGKAPRNYWIPSTILMELVLFAKQAYDRGDEEIFTEYMEILKDILKKSESAKYELCERAITGSGGFRNEVLKMTGF